MMLSYLLTEGGSETIIVCLDPVDLLSLLTGVELALPLADLKRTGEDAVGHLERATLVLLGPGAKDALLRRAVEARDSGVDVRIEKVDYPGAPEADDGEA